MLPAGMVKAAACLESEARTAHGFAKSVKMGRCIARQSLIQVELNMYFVDCIGVILMCKAVCPGLDEASK